LADLPEGAVVGTTSLRRRMQLLRKRPDLVVKDLRGNVNTRLRKLAEGQYDAIILAYIGLKRLELLEGIPHVEKLDFFIPPMGQAALGIEIVSNNPLAREVAESLNDPDTYLCTQIERDFVAAIGAGCSAPVAVNAVIENDTVHVRTMLGFPDGTRIMEESLSAPRDGAHDLGKELARIVIDRGAKTLLAEAEKVAFKDEMPERL
jgi:hydroxymethylbilane synthase